jgi:hypothetical protein
MEGYINCEIRPDIKRLLMDEVKQRKKEQRPDASQRRIVEQALLAYLTPASFSSRVAAGVADREAEHFRDSLMNVIVGDVSLQSLADSFASPWSESPGSGAGTYLPKVPTTTPRHAPEFYGHPFRRKT